MSGEEHPFDSRSVPVGMRHSLTSGFRSGGRRVSRLHIRREDLRTVGIRDTEQVLRWREDDEPFKSQLKDFTYNLTTEELTVLPKTKCRHRVGNRTPDRVTSTTHLPLVPRCHTCTSVWPKVLLLNRVGVRVYEREIQLLLLSLYISYYSYAVRDTVHE